MASRAVSFAMDVQTIVTNVLQHSDNWSALKEENNARDWFNTITQADLDAAFGSGFITLQQFKDALSSMQTLVDSIHTAPINQRLYKLKK